MFFRSFVYLLLNIDAQNGPIETDDDNVDRQWTLNCSKHSHVTHLQHKTETQKQLPTK